MKVNNFILCILAVLVTSCSTTHVKHVQDYEKLVDPSKKVVILQPYLDVNHVDVSGRKIKLSNYEAHIADIITERLANAIDGKGLKATILNKSEIDKELSRDILELRDNYAKIINEKIYSGGVIWGNKKPTIISYNIEPFSTSIGKRMGSDILLFVDYARFVQTKALRALSLAAGALAGGHAYNVPDSAIIIIGLVNAQDGKLLWVNRFEINGSLFSTIIEDNSKNQSQDIKHIENIIKGVLKEFKVNEVSKESK